MLKLQLRIFCVLLFAINTAFAWDFAVTTQSKIVFYDAHWKEVTSSAHQFEHLGAITFDEAEEKVYFNDEIHHNGSIFSLMLPKEYDEPHLIEKMVQRTKNESIRSLAYDPLERKLYWSDALNKKIFVVSVDANETTQPNVFMDFAKEDTELDGITIDFCRRILFWTNSNFSNPSIERIDLNGNNRKVIVHGEMWAPHGIVVDQLTDRIYFVVAQRGIHFSVESANLDGSDRKIIMKGLNNEPFNLAVTKDDIYWTDNTNRAIWGHAKFVHETAKQSEQRARAQAHAQNDYGYVDEPEDGDEYENENENEDENENLNENADADENETHNTHSESAGAHMILKYADKPRGIVARVHYLSDSQNDEHCHKVIATIKNRIDAANKPPTPGGGGGGASPASAAAAGADSSLVAQNTFLQKNYCLNGGELVPQSIQCICKIGYKGARCEIDECRNYCMHGQCVISTLGLPTCECPHSHHGRRCQLHKCAGHCLNEGRCVIEVTGEPSCECRENFGGARCEHNSTEICSLFCKILKLDAESYVPFGCRDICNDLAQLSEYGSDKYAVPKYTHLDMCQQVNPWSGTVIVVTVCGVIASLGLMLLIVHGLRRFYKPARPRIRKTFVVRKQAATPCSDTPLTNRPIATEQCEITIENCCNMNICDTPCFDTKLLEQTLSTCNSKVKEDKKMLINSMEDDLY